MIEKRLIMRFLSWAMDLDLTGEDFASWTDRSEEELYKEYKLTDNLVMLIRGALVNATEPSPLPACDVIRQVQTYLKNVGIYGTIPYIFPIYGAAEIAQAFVRYSAVFGSVYVLAMGVTSLDRDEGGEFCGVTLENGQKITGKHCVISPNYDVIDDNDVTQVHHLIYLTEQSVKPVTKVTERDDVSLLYIPSNHGDSNGNHGDSAPVIGYEFGENSGVSSENTYLVHLTSHNKTSLDRAAGEMIPDSSSLYKISYSTNMTQNNKPPEIKGGVVRTGRPVYTSGYGECIREAERVFRLLAEDAEFLPAAPDPEDFKWDEEEGEEGVQVGSNGNTEEEGVSNGNTAGDISGNNGNGVEGKNEVKAGKNINGKTEDVLEKSEPKVDQIVVENSGESQAGPES
eukprot:sb/3465388/